jgi:hypothetical protein
MSFSFISSTIRLPCSPSETVVKIIDGRVELAVAAQGKKSKGVLVYAVHVRVLEECGGRQKFGLAALRFPFALRCGQRPMEAAGCPHTRVEIVENLRVRLRDRISD